MVKIIRNIWEKLRKSLQSIKPILKHALIACISAVIVTSFSWVTIKWSDQIVLHAVKRVGDFLDNHKVLVGIIMTVIVVCLWEIILKTISIIRIGRIGEASGIFFFKHNATKRDLRKSKKFQKKYSKGCSNLYILGATGWKTFGSKQSPLHHALLNCQEASIIIISPLSDTIQYRAKDLQILYEEYKKEIYQTIDCLKLLKDSGKNISLRMYKRYPLWKYIVLGNYVWVQQYPRERIVQESPCYAFAKRQSINECIYDHIYRQFLVRWDSYFLGRYNFATDKLEFFDEEGHLKGEEQVGYEEWKKSQLPPP